MNPTSKESLQASVLPELWHALVQRAPVPMVVSYRDLGT